MSTMTFAIRPSRRERMKKRTKQKQKKPQIPETFAHQPFLNLDKLYRQAAAGPKPIETRTDTPPQKNEDDIFLEAMRGVREIRAFREIALQKRRLSVSLKRGKTRAEGLDELEGIISGERSIRLSDTQEYVEWVNPVYGRELIRELHRGRFAVQDCIDLHGFTLTEAVNALQDFLAEARQRGFRCVKIIHGRGLRSPQGPVLKNAVISFLSSRYRKHVIGFVTARKNDSGLGALYVLLA